jgi:hypothetical protein
MHAQEGVSAPDGRPDGRAPLSSRALALHGVSGTSSGSHLGSTLTPGRAVLTRGVSRRSGSVAYIRADASPTEVLAGSMLASETRSVKPPSPHRLWYWCGPTHLRNQP